MRSFVLSLLFLAFSSPCNGADAGAFIEPTDGSGSVGASFITNPVWYVGDAHTLKWTTSQTTYNITLWQQNATTNAAHYGYSPVFSWSKLYLPVHTWSERFAQTSQAQLAEVQEPTTGSFSLGLLAWISKTTPSSFYSVGQDLPSQKQDSHPVTSISLLPNLLQALHRYRQARPRHRLLCLASEQSLLPPLLEA